MLSDQIEVSSYKAIKLKEVEYDAHAKKIEFRERPSIEVGR